MKTFSEFITETPSPSMGTKNFLKIAAKNGFDAKLIGNGTTYELYDIKTKKYIAMFDPTIQSEDLLEILRAKTDKK